MTRPGRTRPKRLLSWLALLCLVLLAPGLTSCKSKADRKKDYEKCIAACVSTFLPGGTGGQSVETALRLSGGGGPCMTKCKNANKSVMKRIKKLFK